MLGFATRLRRRSGPLVTRPWWIAAWTSLIALSPRWQWALVEHPPKDFLLADMAIYLQRGVELGTRAAVPADTFTPVGYPLFLRLMHALSPGDLVLVAVVQAVLSAVTVGLASLYARQLDDAPVTQWLTGLALAWYFPLTLYTGFLLTETLFAALLVAALLALLLALSRRGRVRLALAVGAGLCLGAAILVRPSLLPLAPLLGLVALRFRPARAALGLTLALAALVLVPVSWRNTSILGRPALLATNGGVNFFLAHSTCRAVVSEGPGIKLVTTHYNRNHFDHDCHFTEPVFDEATFYRAGLSEIAAHPSRLVRAFVGVGEGLGLAPYRPWPNVPYWPGSMQNEERINHFSRAFFWLVMLPALLHAAWLWRSAPRPRELSPRLLGWCVLTSVLFVLYVYNGNPRVRVSSDPISIALAAAAWVALARRALELSAVRSLRARFGSGRRA